MSLIKCPECGKEISNKAMICPNCGYVLRTTTSTASLLVFVLPILNLAIAVTLGINGILFIAILSVLIIFLGIADIIKSRKLRLLTALGLLTTLLLIGFFVWLIFNA